MSWTNPSDEHLRAIFERTRRIALVGASPQPSRPSHGVMHYLLQAGYEVIPVRPGGGQVLGVPCVERLADLEEIPDLIDVFRASEFVSGIVDEAIALGAPVLWLQDGVIDEAAAARGTAAGLTVVMDDCTLRVHRRLMRSGY